MVRKKVLLADDSATSLLIERLILADEPYEVILAKDGQEALEKAICEQPDAIVLDVVMPKLDGFEVCRRLRRQDETRGIPIILVTTRGEPENIEMGYEVGCSAYVTKPINNVEFLVKLREQLSVEP